MLVRQLIMGLAGLAAAVALSGCLGRLTAEPITPGTPTGQIADPAIPGLTPVRDGERLAISRSVAMGRIGRDEDAVYVLRRRDAPPDQPLLIWLHGYGTNHVGSQEPWLNHMTKTATVVFPAYAKPPFPVGRRFGQIAWPVTARALRRALRRLDYDPRRVVVGGYSLGGALANDYARNWRAEALPKPAGIYSLYAGRALAGGEVLMPRQPGTVAPDTELVQVASRDDLLAGTREASFMIATTPRSVRRRLILIRDYALGDHFGPTRFERAERRRFWRPLDELVARVDARASASS